MGEVVGSSTRKANEKGLNPRAVVSPMQRTRLRLETGCDIGTIGRWIRGEMNIRESTHLRLCRACMKLGIEVLG